MQVLGMRAVEMQAVGIPALRAQQGAPLPWVRHPARPVVSALPASVAAEACSTPAA